tara:strand:+ start:2285 stop:2806 length:522 start_codon:yes stop_codon:yes gene_type:complete
MWEEAVDDIGRVYYWNTETHETSWVIPLKMKDKTLVKTEMSVENDSVKLRLIKSQPKNKIVNRIWKQLDEKQREFYELEEIFRNNIVSKVFSTSVYLIFTSYFKYWKDVVYNIKIDEACLKTIYTTRWKESIRYKNTFCDTLKMLHKENKELLYNLVEAKTMLAQENYAFLKK